MIPHGGHELIAAPATPTGGALAVVRLSGEGAIACCDRLFRGRRPLSDAPAGSVRFGTICDGERMVDEVLVTLFRAPHSYTGEEMAGSVLEITLWMQRQSLITSGIREIFIR